MHKNRRRIIFISIVIIIIIAIVVGVKISNDNKRKFQAESAQVYSYSQTTNERVNTVVITLPEEDTLVGLNDGKGIYVSKAVGTEGTVTVDTSIMKTQFVPGVYKKTHPRQDALAPMNVSADTHGGSTYVDLFTDRGDVAIEKSYVRLGGTNVIVKNISTLPATAKNEDYNVNIVYTVGTTPHAVTIPVVDGRFYQKESTPVKTSPTSATSVTQTSPKQTVVTPPKTTTPTSPAACTMDAKQCPDGTFVGRSGPKCEFSACPALPQQSTVASIGQRIYTNGVYITPLEIIEDSRCPSGLNCIWAGRLRIKVQLERGGQTSQSMLDLGVNSIVLMDKKITLVRATPTPRPQDTVMSNQYTFEFNVTTGTTNQSAQ